MNEELIDKITQFSKIYLGELNINLKDWFINTVPLILDTMINDKDSMSFDYSYKFDKSFDGETKNQFDEHLRNISYNLKEANPSTSSFNSKILEKAKDKGRHYLLKRKLLKESVDLQDFNAELEKARAYRQKHLELALMEFVQFFDYLVNDFNFR